MDVKKEDSEQNSSNSDCDIIITKEEIDSIKYDSSDAESYTSNKEESIDKKFNILKRKINNEGSEVPFKTTFQGRAASDQSAVDSSVNFKYMKIFNLPVHWNDNETNDWVEKECGTIKSFYFYKDEQLNFHGSILVTFDNTEQRDKAMENLQDKEVDNKKLVLELYDSIEDPKISMDLSAVVKKNIIRKVTWPPYLDKGFDIWAVDPAGYYGFMPRYLDTLGIVPPIDRWIHVSNFKCNREELKQLLELAGHVMICHLFTSPQMYAKVMYSHPIEAVQAISMFHKQLFYGVPLMVVMDIYPSEHGILPEGMNKIGPGFGSNNKALKNVVMQYERYLFGWSSTLNHTPFRHRNSHLFYHDPIYSAEAPSKFSYHNSETVTFLPQCSNSQEMTIESGDTNSSNANKDGSNIQQKHSSSTNQNFSNIGSTSGEGQTRKPLLPDPLPQYKGWSVSGANNPGLMGPPSGLRGSISSSQRPGLFQKPLDPQTSSPPMRSQFSNPSGNNYSAPFNPMFNNAMAPSHSFNSNAGGSMVGPNFVSGVRNGMIGLINQMLTSNISMAGQNIPVAHPNYMNHGNPSLCGQNFPSATPNDPVAGFNNVRFSSNILRPNSSNIEYRPNNHLSIINANITGSFRARFGSNDPMSSTSSYVPNFGPNYRPGSNILMNSFGNSMSNTNAPLPVPPPNVPIIGPNVNSNTRNNPNSASRFKSKSVRSNSNVSDSAVSSNTSENFYTLKISNLPRSVGFIELCEFISQNLENKSMISLQITKPGSALVKFNTQFDAESCLRKLNGTSLYSNVIDVEFA